MGFGLALIGRFKLWLYAAGAALVAIGAAYLRGRSDQAEKEHERELNEYVETRKRMDNAAPSNGLDYLHERKSKRGL
jgi:hypothetical protein